MTIDNGRAIGWIGAIEDDDVWEIQPIAVAPAMQRSGLGRALVADIEWLARSAGAVAVWAGTSDETHATNLSSVDLYADPVTAMANFSAVEGHPARFWQKAGFTLVGVRPDEEGLGQPGIHFARRLV